ncbi:MAG: hypothetical protein ABI255_05875 [Microbacteriaceae bacterium]
MTGRVAAIVMAALLVIYLVVLGQRAVLLVGTGSPIGIAMGVALLVLPVIGAWVLVRELMFGVHTQALVRILEREDDLPADDLPRRPSGRPVRAAADARFPAAKARVDAEPESWRAWFRLGMAYDDSGDRRRARAAIREAIRLQHRAGAGNR